MKGIQFVFDDTGQKVAVLIDLSKHGQLWEDFYDSLLARERAEEPRESLDDVKERRLITRSSMFDHLPSVAGVYAIVNKTNGHRYVGQAKNMNARMKSHFRDLEKGIHRTSEDRRLQNAWNDFGRDVFEFVVLEIVYDNSAETNYHVRPDNLSLAEHFFIHEQSEYNVDKRIVRAEFKLLIDTKAWREPR